MLIVTHVKLYELLHPFIDGNLRTMTKLLNLMLAQIGLPPTTLYDPFIFHLMDSKTLVKLIKEGMNNTLQLINSKEPYPELFGFRSHEMESAAKEEKDNNTEKLLQDYKNKAAEFKTNVNKMYEAISIPHLQITGSSTPNFHTEKPRK